MENLVRLKIKSIYNDLSNKEQTIADYILENPFKFSHSAISNISTELNVADSTIFQFAKKLGYNGFKDLKLAILVQENDLSAISLHENITKDDNELMMAQKVFDSTISSLEDTRSLLKLEDLKLATNLISNSNRLFLFGVGGSQITASDAYHKFLRASISVHHHPDYHIQLMEASLINSNDCALFISHTGRSKETKKLAETAKKNGAKIIVITSQENSPLAKFADIVLLSVAEETAFRSEALSSRISQLCIIDSLYVIYMFFHQETSQNSLSKVRATIADTKEN